MIITKLILENFKQYRGEHIIDIAEDATIGVVGANGVGKTTIFEAIEWCLYNPRQIENKNIRPRGTGGEVRVVVQLTTDDGREVYEVERVLKRAGVQAAVYRIGDMGDSVPIVQGTRDVTDHISTRLIGLGHAAFVATFFTRQKELGFFGDLRPTERRREVGKLLGFETIKEAQRLIGDERGDARSTADSLRAQVESISGERDLAAEIAAVTTEIADHRELVERATKARETAVQATADRETELTAQRELRDRFTAILGELRDLETRRQHAAERRESISTELERLAKREMERAGFARTAADEPSLRAERARLEAERERFQQRERVTSEMQGCGQTIDRGLADLRDLVERTRAATDDPGWAWTKLDDQQPLGAIDRLTGIATAVDSAANEARMGLYVAAVGSQKKLDQEFETLQKYRDRQRELEQIIEEALADGDPAEQRRDLETRQEAARAAAGEAQALISNLQQQETRARDLAGKLGHQHFDEACPTCGRAFSDHEAELVIQTLHQSIDRYRAEIARAKATASEAEAVLERVKADLAVVQQKETLLRDSRTRLETSSGYISQQEAKVAAEETALHSVLRQIGLPATPSADEITEVERSVRRSRALQGTIQPLVMLRRTIGDAREAIQRHEASLAGLADIEWDPAAYREVSDRFTAASNAISAVHQIDRELARRPQLEQDLEVVTNQLAELDDGIAEQVKLRDSVGFDQAALQAATVAVQEARQAERARQAELTAAERAERDAGYRLETLRKDEQQLKDLATRAEQKRLEWQELDLMYREFSEFDKYVAQKLAPQLNDTTSDIVAAMTDGKYDRVEFDEDYGIEVFDGDQEKFALETFSGGERDAIALAARLALSRMIGSQAANPPGFLVLDEVFGSLDAERRERVLALLGQHSTDFFRQMFIISHIDDVQQSPVFDTIWQIVRNEDGASELQTGPGDAIAAD